MSSTPSSSLAGKVFLVTGGASGIGLATVHKLLERGALLAICDVDEDALSTLKSSLLDHGDRVLVQATNVTSRDSVRSFLHATIDHFKRKVSGIASVAGTGGRFLGRQGIWQTTDDEYQYIMDVNVRGTFHMLSEAMNPKSIILTEAGDAVGSTSSIVCVGSVFSCRGFKQGAVFSASKHAMVGMVKAAAQEAGARGVRVNAVLPGVIDTPMHRNNMANQMVLPIPDTPIQRMGRAEEVAEVIVFLLEERSSFVTGSEYSVDGGWNA